MGAWFDAKYFLFGLPAYTGARDRLFNTGHGTNRQSFHLPGTIERRKLAKDQTWTGIKPGQAGIVSTCEIIEESGPELDWIDDSMGVSNTGVATYSIRTNSVFKPNEFVQCFFSCSGAGPGLSNCAIYLEDSTNFKADATGIINFLLAARRSNDGVPVPAFVNVMCLSKK